MTIQEPHGSALEGLDLEHLDAIEDHARALFRNGPIDPHVFRALWAAGLKAAKGNVALLETLRMFKPEGVTL